MTRPISSGLPERNSAEPLLIERKPSWVRPSRPRKGYRTGHRCVVCGEVVQRHPLDTDVTYASRDLCSRACMRKSKGTQAERGRMRWEPEAWRC